MTDKDIDAAYLYVLSMVDKADDKTNLMWNEWALREAFLAGVKYSNTPIFNSTFMMEVVDEMPEDKKLEL